MCNRSDPFGLRDCTTIQFTVTDENGSTSSDVRLCDSRDREGQAGWEKGSRLDNLITSALDQPGEGFAPGFGTIYVHDAGDAGTVVHELSHELLARRAGARYQLRGAFEVGINQVPTVSTYNWDLSKGWFVGYENQAQEARARTDQLCYLGDALSCIRTPYRFSFP